jgi:hypothetical protein
VTTLEHPGVAAPGTLRTVVSEELVATVSIYFGEYRLGGPRYHTGQSQ